MAEGASDEDREKARELYFGDNDLTQSEIAEEVDVSPGTITKWKAEWEAQKEEREQLESTFLQEGASVTAERVAEAAKTMDGVGKKKAKSLKNILELREGVLKDPNELYKVAQKVLETDKFWTEYLVRAVYPHMDESNAGPGGGSGSGVFFGNDNSQQQQPQQPQQPPQFNMGGGQSPPQQQQSPFANNQQQQQPGNQMEMMMTMMQQQMQQQQEMIQAMAENQESDDETDSEVEVLRQELRSMREEMSSDTGPLDQIKELVEAQETLKQLSGDDDSGSADVEQLAGVLQQEIAQLRQEFQADDSPDIDPAILNSGDSSLATLALLAESTDMDASAIQSLAGEIGEVESDPEVAKKKYEKDIKELEVESKQERYDAILQAIENSAESLVGIVGQGIAGGGEPPEAAEEVVPDERPQQATNGAESDISPAQRMVMGMDEAEDEQPQAEPAREPEHEPVREAEADPEPEPEPEPGPEQTGDGGEVVEQETIEDPAAVCPGCGQEFDSERGFWGHKSHCDDLNEGDE
jgi:transposase/AcrR family transcriptional regulator